MSDIIQKLWGFCHTLRHDGVNYDDYIGQVAKLTPSLLALAWTHSLPARSGCALSLREILFARSQRVQIAGKLVPQDPTDEPAEKLLERIRTQTT